MKIPVNEFKKGLSDDLPQIGLWVALAHAYPAELLAGTGFDWLLLDAEHGPNDPLNILPQLQAIEPYSTTAIVRPVKVCDALIKQYLDIGVQTLLMPMVETAAQAHSIVAATRYPPHGIRGVGSGLARASRWNGVENYLSECESELCVLVQVESLLGVENLLEIAAVEGVDGVFFGPADLSASMGLLGKPNHKAVKQVILDGISKVRSMGKSAGLLATDQTVAQEYLDAGARFVAVGADTTLLANSAKTLLASFKEVTGSNDKKEESIY